MSLLFKILYATHANGTHHKLALDALHHLRDPNAEAWRKVFLKHAETYLEGSKAPDKEFKDFTNHVLHVRDGYWGGAAEKATNWYGHVVVALKNKKWDEAVYAAGVLSHYYTDPIMPFHTAQSEAENNIHRAGEWSISKSYNDLNKLAKTYPVPDVPIEDREDWIADLVCDAAEISNGFYETLISNYDIDRGVVDPPLGLNDRARRIIAQLIAYAQVGQARILDRAFAEAGVSPPDVELTAASVVAGLKIPLKWVLRKMTDAEDKATVRAMYDELQATGTVEKTLPEDDRAVREGFRRDVGDKSRSPRPKYRPPHVDGAFDYASALDNRAETAEGTEHLTAQDASREVTDENVTPAAPEAPVEAAPIVSAVAEPEPSVAEDTPETPETAAETAPKAETKDEQPFDQAAVLRERASEMREADAAAITSSENTPEFRLHLEDEVEDGPSVGPKTAIRLNKIGIVTVADLLNADPKETADALDVSYIRASTVLDWQDQARMQCDVPGLSGTASQLIVGAGFRRAGELAAASIAELRDAVERFAASSDGDRILRDRPIPSQDRMERWIANANPDRARSAA
ncbi:MAG: DUF4332 domain-containing protein [Hyphomicrobiaceae bacterium]